MSGNRKLTIIATKGTLDWAYPPFSLASTAAALGMDCAIFFTFSGLNLLLKDTSTLKVTPTGNPSMPMKMPLVMRVHVTARQNHAIKACKNSSTSEYRHSPFCFGLGPRHTAMFEAACCLVHPQGLQRASEMPL